MRRVIPNVKINCRRKLEAKFWLLNTKVGGRAVGKESIQKPQEEEVGDGGRKQRKPLPAPANLPRETLFKSAAKILSPKFLASRRVEGRDTVGVEEHWHCCATFNDRNLPCSF